MLTPEQESALHIWYCANPACSGRGRDGKSHLIMKASLGPLSIVKVKCRYCRKWTTIVTGPDQDSVRKS